jgi:hypothetical protein
LNGGLVIALGNRYCRNHAACATAQQAQVRCPRTIGNHDFRKAEWSGAKDVAPPSLRAQRRSEAIQNLSAEAVWIASLRSQ